MLVSNKYFCVTLNTLNTINVQSFSLNNLTRILFLTLHQRLISPFPISGRIVQVLMLFVIASIGLYRAILQITFMNIIKSIALSRNLQPKKRKQLRAVMPLAHPCTMSFKVCICFWYGKRCTIYVLFGVYFVSETPNSFFSKKRQTIYCCSI